MHHHRAHGGATFHVCVVLSLSVHLVSSARRAKGSRLAPRPLRCNGILGCSVPSMVSLYFRKGAVCSPGRACASHHNVCEIGTTSCPEESRALVGALGAPSYLSGWAREVGEAGSVGTPAPCRRRSERPTSIVWSDHDGGWPPRMSLAATAYQP
jgi:hypothetical protein